MLALPVSRQRPLPLSLTHPTGIHFLPPSQRVSPAELDKRDAQWRAIREAAYARAWSEDATLVGSCRSYGDDGRSVHRGDRRRRKAVLKFIKWMEGRQAR